MKIKRPKKNFDKLTKAKVRIVAHLIGDGCVYQYKHNYNIRYEVKDQESLESFEKDILRVYGLSLTKGFNPSGKTKKPIPFLLLRSKIVFQDLQKYASYFSSDWAIKKIILKSSLQIKKEFLKALFDDEGSVFEQANKGKVRLYSINKQGLKQIQRILTQFEITSNLIGGFGAKRNVYGLETLDLQKFKDKIGFNLTRKNLKLEELIRKLLNRSVEY